MEVLNGFRSNIAVNAWKMVNFAVKNVQVNKFLPRKILCFWLVCLSVCNALVTLSLCDLMEKYVFFICLIKNFTYLAIFCFWAERTKNLVILSCNWMSLSICFRNSRLYECVFFYMKSCAF